MPIRVAPVRALAERSRAKDPEHDGLRRAIRAGITVPLATGFSLAVVGGTAAPLFTLLGAFWLMVVTDFPGNRQNRALAYLGLGLNGCVLVALGTWVAPIGWLAVTLTFVLGVAVTVAGVASETVSAGQRATLLFFVWPVCTPVGPIGERLLGLLISYAICIPASLFLLPPRHHGELRRHAAQVCVALADRIEGIGSAAAVTAAMDALRANFLAASFRPVGLSAGSRALVRIVDALQLVTDRVDDSTADVLGPVQRPATDVLRCCAHLMDEPSAANRAANCAALNDTLPRLRSLARGRYREDVTLLLDEPDDAAAVAIGERLLTCRVLATTIGLIGRVIAAAAVADARPVWARALGLRLPPTGFADRVLPETVAATSIPTSFLTVRSVTAQNSLRTGLGLALAVAITHLFPVQHGFWVVLGTIAVLGSSALTTGTKVLQAVSGTAVGVTLGSLLIAAFTPHPVVLWSLLPIAVFGSTYLPRLFSYAVGQAMIAFTVLIILDLIDPAGWQVGLLRLEDVAMGAGVGVAVSLLLWPRGAAAAISTVIDSALDADLRYLQAAVARVTRGSPDDGADELQALSNTALMLSRIVDDAVRQYLSETGSGADLRTPVVRAANRATWVRAAADMIADIKTLPPPGAYPSARAVLEAHMERIATGVPVPHDPEWPALTEEFVRALRAEAAGEPEPIEAAQPLVTVAANLAELQLELVPASEGEEPSTRSPVK
ncbi:MAG TPA: FUSC family protein [Mycobacterium sp.]|nr:FUSC family protein [Mycobacterium sp.]HTX96881.1 FUSC family protein [Mycobacterium sp.]